MLDHLKMNIKVLGRNHFLGKSYDDTKCLFKGNNVKNNNNKDNDNKSNGNDTINGNNDNNDNNYGIMLLIFMIMIALLRSIAKIFILRICFG